MNTVEQISVARREESENEQVGSSPESSNSVVALPRRTVRRWEIGFFVRKIVNGCVVSEWQFPQGRQTRAVEASGSGDPGVQQVRAQGAQATEVRAMAHAAQDETTENDDAAGPTSETITYEAGFFVRHESTVPPVYKDPPDG